MVTVTDSLSDSDVKRVDKRVDPTATTADDIEESLDDSFEGGARDAFAEALEEQRAPVREEARDLLSDRLSTNPADGTSQLRNSQGQFAPKTAEVVGSPDVDQGGRVTVETTEGRVELGEIDVDTGVRGSRGTEYSR